MSTIYFIDIIMLQSNEHLYRMDRKINFLNDVINENIYMTIPKDVTISNKN